MGGVTWHRIGWGAAVAPPVGTLNHIIAMLGHQGRTIDILKADIEGSEFHIIDQIDPSVATNHIQQLCLEVHIGGKTPKDTDALFLKIQAGGYVMFHREENYATSNCYEFSFIRLKGS